MTHRATAAASVGRGVDERGFVVERPEDGGVYRGGLIVDEGRVVRGEGVNGGGRVWDSE